MSLNYIKPDEEFFGCMKLTSGEELLGRIVVVEEHKGFYCAFIQDPAKVHSPVSYTHLTLPTIYSV